jgi:hypothetical protein
MTTNLNIELKTTSLWWALFYADPKNYHWKCFPVPKGQKKSEKAEAHSDGRKWGASDDLDELRRDFTKWSEAGIGVPTGKINGIVVIETDTKKGHPDLAQEGEESLKQIEAELQTPLPTTLMAKSPSGSIHRFYKYPDDSVLQEFGDCFRSSLVAGIDIMADGDMVVVPPSEHRFGGRYCWINELPITDLPLAWLKRAAERRQGSNRQTNFEIDIGLVHKAVSSIPNNDVHYDEWVRRAYAIKWASRGSEDGFIIFDEHSRKSTKYDAAYTRKTWNGLKPDGRIGFRTLDWLAAQYDPNYQRVRLDPPPDYVSNINHDHALVLVSNKAAVMRLESGPDFRLLQVDSFKQWFANQCIEIDEKPVSIAKLWFVHPQRRQYQGIEFVPNGGRSGYYNLWQGFAVEPRQGSCQLFLDHLKDNVAQGDDDLYKWVVGWFAQIFQQPDQKMGTALVLRGKMGVGKTKVGEVIGALLDPHYVLVAQPRYVTGQFNSHMRHILLLQADEAFWAGDKAAEGRLKDLVTGKKHLIELKNFEPIFINNYIRLFVTGNEHWVWPAGFDERRGAILDVGDQHAEDHLYFAAIDNEMDNGGREALLYHLLNFDLSQVNLRVIPKTDALLEQKIEGMTSQQAWWLDMLKKGLLPWGAAERNACPKTKLYYRYIKHAKLQGVNRRAIEVSLGMFLSKVCGSGLTSTKVDAIIPVYRFPSLKECRALFEKRIGQALTWDDEHEDWGFEPVPKGPDPDEDEEIPF